MKEVKESFKLLIIILIMTKVIDFNNIKLIDIIILVLIGIYIIMTIVEILSKKRNE